MTRKALARVVGWTVSAACLAFFLAQAHRGFSQATASLDATVVAAAIARAMIPYLCAYVALAGAWFFLLRTLGMRPTVRCASGIYFSTQIAKYLPGNIGQHVGRVYLSAEHGLGAFRVGLSLAIEMVLIIAVAALMSLPLAPRLLAKLGTGGPGAGTVALASALALALAVVAYALRRTAFLVSARHHLVSALVEARTHGSLRYLPAAVALIVLAMALAGASLLLLCLDLRSLDGGTLLFGVALVSASWVFGFLTPGAPAGLGVREAILLAGLVSIVDRQAALEATLMFRGVSLAADVLAFAAGRWLLRAPVPAHTGS